MINSRSSHSDYQAFYTTMLGIILGGVSVLPLALRPPFKWSEMQSVWPWLGGLCTLPAFGMLVAVPSLGVQATLLIVLCGQLVSTTAIDAFDGRPLFGAPKR